MSADPRFPRGPQRGETWILSANTAVTCLVVGRTSSTVIVESDASFINGRAEYSTALFMLNFERSEETP